MASFKTLKKVSDQTTLTSTTPIIITPVDIRNFESFSVMLQNNNTAIGLSSISVQVAPSDQIATAANLPPDWVNLSTAILDIPNNLGPTASSRSSRVNNCYGYMRILANTTSTAAAGLLTVKIEGKQLF